MKALIFENKVVQIAAQEFPVAPALQWIDITGLTPQPEVGWSFDGATFAGPPSPPLSELKRDKREEFRSETVRRMSAQVPAWNQFETIEFLLSITNLLNVANLTAAQTVAKDILQWNKNTAIPKVNAMATKADVLAVDVTLADPFGDGTLWPT